MGDGDLKAKEGPRVLSTTSDIIRGFIGKTKRRMNLHGKSYNKWVISEASVTVKGSYNTKVPSESDLVMGNADNPLAPSGGGDRLVSRAKVIENQVMAISVISISSDSSEDSVGSPAGRVILFGTIPTTIPDTTPVSTPPATQTDTPRLHQISFDASSDSSSRYSLSDHSSPDLPSTSAGPSARDVGPQRSLYCFITCIRVPLSPGHVIDTSLRELRIWLSEQDIISEIQAEIGECIAYADALRDRGIDARVVVEAVDRDKTETGVRGPVEGDRIVGVESAVTTLTERVAELERDNRRLRGTMPNTRSGASMTHEEVEELVTHQVAEEMEAREAARTLEPLNENGDEQEGGNGGNRGNGNRGNRGNGNGGNGGNGNGGNGENRNGGNGHRNGNHGMNYGGFMPVA
ncbi:hypothetical protein Tco_1419424 [Tanacetum coccineum]